MIGQQIFWQFSWVRSHAWFRKVISDFFWKIIKVEINKKTHSFHFFNFQTHFKQRIEIVHKNSEKNRKNWKKACLTIPFVDEKCVQGTYFLNFEKRETKIILRYHFRKWFMVPFAMISQLLVKTKTFCQNNLFREIRSFALDL